jgi:RNA polymerase sigma-70 factor (ECF subfamily)
MSTQIAETPIPCPSGPSAVAAGPVGAAMEQNEALRVVYAEHAGALLAYVRRLLLGDRERAADVVQETMLRAWRTAGVLDPEKPSLRPWLFTVARNIVIDSHRRRSARPPEVDGDVLQHLPGADEIDATLTSLAVTDAMSALCESHRQVLWEVYFRGSKIGEASKTLGIPAGTVKSRTYYALRALRLALEERGITAQL